jgi:hypothetical protein
MPLLHHRVKQVTREGKVKVTWRPVVLLCEQNAVCLLGMHIDCSNQPPTPTDRSVCFPVRHPSKAFAAMSRRTFQILYKQLSSHVFCLWSTTDQLPYISSGLSTLLTRAIQSNRGINPKHSSLSPGIKYLAAC